MQYTVSHPRHGGIRAWIICKYIPSLLLMVRCHKGSFQCLQNTVLAFLVVTAFDQCTLQNVLLIFYPKILCENCSWLTWHPFPAPSFLSWSTLQSGKLNTYSSASFVGHVRLTKSVEGFSGKQSWWEGGRDAEGGLSSSFFLPGVLMWCPEVQQPSCSNEATNIKIKTKKLRKTGWKAKKGLCLWWHH